MRGSGADGLALAAGAADYLSKNHLSFDDVTRSAGLPLVQPRMTQEKGFYAADRHEQLVRVAGQVDLVAVGDSIALGIEIGPVAAHPLARVAGFAIAAVAQHQDCFSLVIGRHKRAMVATGSGMISCRA